MNSNPITIAPIFSPGLILLLFGVALAAVGVQYRLSRAKLGTRRALMLSLLRLLAAASLLACALNPSLVTTSAHTLSPAIAIVVDTSDSMGQSSSTDPASRLDKVKALLTGGQSPLLNALNDNYAISLYGLSDSMRSLEFGDLAGLTAGGNKGDFAKALQALSPMSSVAILFSDGNLQWSSGQGQRPATLTVAMGNPEAYRDILIEEIKSPAIAFRDREVVIDITMKTYGYEGLTLPVMLQESGKLLAVKDVRLEGDRAELTASLSFVPRELGRKNLAVSIPHQIGENLFANNQKQFTINVVRDKTRILMVSGTPSTNYRFMRAALKSDPSIDLLSFVILRTPSDILNVPPQQQSLIPFPVETLFKKELHTFDLLIFDNFNYALYLAPEYLESIGNFVEDGGGFAVIGGPNLYNEAGDNLSPLAE